LDEAIVDMVHHRATSAVIIVVSCWIPFLPKAWLDGSQ